MKIVKQCDMRFQRISHRQDADATGQMKLVIFLKQCGMRFQRMSHRQDADATGQMKPVIFLKHCGMRFQRMSHRQDADATGQMKPVIFLKHCGMRFQCMSHRQDADATGRMKLVIFLKQCGMRFQRMSHRQDANATGQMNLLIFAFFLGLSLFISSCTTTDTQHQVVVSTREQKLAVLDHGNLLAVYPISTSKFGLSDRPGSYGTPLGRLEIAEKIGDNAPPGSVFKDRRRTGEIVAVDSPGRDPIVTRILWLRGREAGNANAFRRDIYIHGTPEERNIGRPVSYGCIRMRSRDVINLYNIVGRGAEVTIVNTPLVTAVPGLVSSSSLDPNRNPAPLVIR